MDRGALVWLEELRTDDVTNAVGDETKDVKDDLLGVSGSVLGDEYETRYKDLDRRSWCIELQVEHGEQRRAEYRENGSDHTDNEAANNHNATDLVVRMVSGGNQEMVLLQKTADTVSKIPVSLASRAAHWDEYPRPLTMRGLKLVNPPLGIQR